MSGPEQNARDSWLHWPAAHVAVAADAQHGRGGDGARPDHCAQPVAACSTAAGRRNFYTISEEPLESKSSAAAAAAAGDAHLDTKRIGARNIVFEVRQSLSVRVLFLWLRLQYEYVPYSYCMSYVYVSVYTMWPQSIVTHECSLWVDTDCTDLIISCYKDFGFEGKKYKDKQYISVRTV